MGDYHGCLTYSVGSTLKQAWPSPGGQPRSCWINHCSPSPPDLPFWLQPGIIKCQCSPRVSSLLATPHNRMKLLIPLNSYDSCLPFWPAAHLQGLSWTLLSFPELLLSQNLCSQTTLQCQFSGLLLNNLAPCPAPSVRTEGRITTALNLEFGDLRKTCSDALWKAREETPVSLRVPQQTLRWGGGVTLASPSSYANSCTFF